MQQPFTRFALAKQPALSARTALYAEIIPADVSAPPPAGLQTLGTGAIDNHFPRPFPVKAARRTFGNDRDYRDLHRPGQQTQRTGWKVRSEK